MIGFHTKVTLDSQKAHEQHLCETRHHHHAPQWPSTIVMPILSTKEYLQSNDLSIQNYGTYSCKGKSILFFLQHDFNQLTFAGLS